MKKLALSAVAAMTVAAAFTSVSDAAPPAPGPQGRKCAMTSSTDVTREAGWQTGAISAGPLATGESGTLHCKIVVNNGNAHNSPWVVHETADASDGVVVMNPRALNYPATAADTTSLCTSWVGASGTLYWVSANPLVPTSQGYWTADGTVKCGDALSIEPNDPECSIWLAIDTRLGTNIAEIWQDCEGYEPII